MADEQETWSVFQDEELVGTIVVDGFDFPWLSGQFDARPHFESLRPLFDREAELLNGTPDFDVDAWEAAYAPITEAGVRLVGPPGKNVTGFILHIEGDRASFRWD